MHLALEIDDDRRLVLAFRQRYERLVDLSAHVPLELLCERILAELETVKNNFLIKKLGLEDGPKLTEAIDKVIADYGSANRNKYRAVVYYLLTKHFGKEAVYG